MWEIAGRGLRGEVGGLVDVFLLRDVSLAGAGLDGLELADGAGAEVLEVGFAGDPDDLGEGTEFVEEAGVAELGLEIGAVADAAHDGDGEGEVGDEVGDEAGDGGDFVVGELGGERGEAGVEGVDGGFLAVHPEADDDFVEGVLSLAEDGEVAVVKGVEAAWVEGDAGLEAGEDLFTFVDAFLMGGVEGGPVVEEFPALLVVGVPGGELEFAEDFALVGHAFAEWAVWAELRGVEVEELPGEVCLRRFAPPRGADEGDSFEDDGRGGIGGVIEEQAGAGLLVIAGPGVINGVVLDRCEQENVAIPAGRQRGDGGQELPEVRGSVPVALFLTPAGGEVFQEVGGLEVVVGRAFLEILQKGHAEG